MPLRSYRGARRRASPIERRRRVRREWEAEDLIACWTLVEADQELVANKSGATRLGFALLLKFFELDARFPRDVGELPPAAVSYVAEQVRVEAGELDAYAWVTSRSVV
jgi:hypothetical protein